ncbi:MAG: phosphatase PAP2 family protein [Eubacteriales bacterium]|jgi:undecaprenyl-diphosphatase
MNMELQILDAIQTIRTPFLDAVMPLISNGVIFWFIFAAVLLIRKDTRRAGLIMIVAMGMDYLLGNVVMKNLFQRVRPCDVNTSVQLLVSRPTDYSFPSGHTSISFAAASGLCFSGSLKKWRIPVLTLAGLIAFSRLYLYVHYPTDVLAGVVVGVFCAWASYRLIRRREKSFQYEEVTA